MSRASDAETSSLGTSGNPTTSAALVDALDAATRAIAGLQSVDVVLQVIVDQVRPLVGAHYAALGIVDADGAIERFITSGITAEERALIGPPPTGHGLLGVIIRENRSLRIPDIGQDPRHYGFPANHPPMTSVLGVPVKVRGRTVGNLYLTDKVGAVAFSDEDERIVETFALHAGIAIDNARLHEQIQRLAIVDERERIGRDLHDGIIQNIYAVGLSLEDVPELVRDDPDEVERLVERAIESLHLTIRDIRNFIFGLRPELLAGVTLPVGLAAIVDEFRHNSMIHIELETAGLNREPDPETTAHLLAIANEALSNVARHSGATQASVLVAADPPGVVTLTVADNGHGFDPSDAAALGHQGLANMRSRATAIDATMDIASDDAGTSVVVRCPVTADVADESTETR